MKKLSVLFFVLILVISCMDGYDTEEFVVFNKSSDTIYSILSPNSSMFGSGFYNEFKKEENYTSQDSLCMFRFEAIPPNFKVPNHDTPRFWNTYFDRSPDNKIRVFIVMEDSVKKYGWKKIFKEEKYIKKYELSRCDLCKKQWEIIYLQ